MSDLHDLGLFALQEVVDLCDVVVGELLHALLGGALLVVADVAVLDQVPEVLDRVTTNVSHRDATLLRHLPGDLHVFLAALLGQLRNGQADHLAVARRSQSEVGLLDRTLDLLHHGRVERLDRQQARLGDADRRDVLQRRRSVVVVDRDAVEERRRSTARAHRMEVLLRRLDGLVHPLRRVIDEVVDRRQRQPPSPLEMIVPTRSPSITRPMLPGASSKTWIGRWLSMQSESAVVSITRSPRSIACRCVISGMNSACGCVRGSPSNTPRTPFFAIRIASAPTSSARSAAAVSVVKYGLPVPAAKITTRPFSRWRIARRRMYGSATSRMSRADCTRVWTSSFSSASWSCSALRTIASIPM